MSLLTYDAYVALTGDSISASATVEANIADAESTIAEYLDRPLVLAEYTERRSLDIDGRVYPKATPITSVPATATYTADGTACLADVSSSFSFLTEQHLGGDGYLVHQPTAVVTYTGGWTEATAPIRLLRAIAFTAHALAHPTLPGDGAGGAASVGLGDASINYGALGAPGAAHGRSWLESLTPGIETAISRYRWVEDYG